MLAKIINNQPDNIDTISYQDIRGLKCYGVENRTVSGAGALYTHLLIFTNLTRDQLSVYLYSNQKQFSLWTYDENTINGKNVIMAGYEIKPIKKTKDNYYLDVLNLYNNISDSPRGFLMVFQLLKSIQSIFRIKLC